MKKILVIFCAFALFGCIGNSADDKLELQPQINALSDYMKVFEDTAAVRKDLNAKWEETDMGLVKIKYAEAIQVLFEMEIAFQIATQYLHDVSLIYIKAESFSGGTEEIHELMQNRITMITKLVEQQLQMLRHHADEALEMGMPDLGEIYTNYLESIKGIQEIIYNFPTFVEVEE